MTSSIVVLLVTFLVLGKGANSSNGPDPSVCTPANATIPLPVPSATLGDVWEAIIEWKDNVKNRTYVIHDTTDMTKFLEKVVISIPLLKDVMLLYDYGSDNVIVQKQDLVNNQFVEIACNVVKQTTTGGANYAFDDLFWLSSLQVPLNMIFFSHNAILKGSTQVRGVNAEKWSACIYNYARNNMTVQANLYFSERSWMSPYLPPNSQVPLRIEFTGKQYNGTVLQNVDLTADIISFKKLMPGQKFPTGELATWSGAFCPNKSVLPRPLPQFPTGLSVLMEVVDMDLQQITYEQLFYSRDLQMVRFDNKPADSGRDSDPTSYIADFVTGVKYVINKRTQDCRSNLLQAGDDLVSILPNNTLTMTTLDQYFHSQGADVQFAGQALVRNVVCDTWIGRYHDADTHRDTTVQWYFTTRPWVEATGYVEGVGTFFMMKVWKAPGNPKIYNVMKYDNLAPDFSAFDFAVCYNHRAKKHFTIKFHVENMQFLNMLGDSYVKLVVVQKLAARLTIQMNRFTDVTFDQDVTTGSLYMSATLLDKAPQASPGSHEISLSGAFSFLEGSIDASHLSFVMTLPNTNVTFTGQSLVEHSFQKEFATTTTTTPRSTSMLVPTLTPGLKTPRPPLTPSPPKATSNTPQPTSVPQTEPPQPPVSTQGVVCPPVTPCPKVTCPSSTAIACPTPKVCPTSAPQTEPPQPPGSTQRVVCPPVTPCPKVTFPSSTAIACPTPKVCPTSKPCSCPESTSAEYVGGQNQSPSSDSSSVSTGALAGGIVAAILVGLAIGIIAMRFYHVTRNNHAHMTINLIEDNNM